ncbi:Flp family type IVb pilin [Actinomadura hibisca]|uniref:Flp family type IVb pilin n=1 Tax=Actinomadura hibisca TaxID=68565 RepID=UPI0012F9B302|nr:hypothetical protein [Actinomadura hibisca]
MRYGREPDSGASAIEYGALLALVTALVAVLLSSMLPVFSTETKTKICQVFQGGACKTTIQAPGGTAAKPGQHTDANGRRVDASGRPVDANGQPFPVDAAGRPLGPDGKPLGIDSNGRPVDSSGHPVDANGRPLGPDGRPLGPDGRPVDANGQPVSTSGQPVTADPNKWGPNWQQNYAGFTTPWDRFMAPINNAVNGFFDGLARGVKEGVQGLLGGIWSDVKGVVEPFIHPIETVKGLWWAVQHPKQAAISLVWDDDSKKDWDSGHKVRAITRAGWNVGSWFIPYYNVGKIVSKIGKFNKLAKVAKAAEAVGKLGKFGRLAKEAEDAAARARKAADAGDVDGVRKATEEARTKTQEAKDEAKRAGCKVGSLGPPRRRASARTPMAAVALTTSLTLRAGRALGATAPTCETGQGLQQKVEQSLRDAGRRLVEKLRNAGPGAHGVQRHLDPDDDKLKWRLGKPKFVPDPNDPSKSIPSLKPDGTVKVHNNTKQDPMNPNSVDPALHPPNTIDNRDMVKSTPTHTAPHQVGSFSTAFSDALDMAVAENKLRQHINADGVAELPISDIPFPAGIQSRLRGYYIDPDPAKTTPNSIAYKPIDFTGGTIKAIYRRDPNTGKLYLYTMYPNPKPGVNP